ncbi:MAG: GNAT family N-acetyltransferase [Ktedonobacteraceae bacterium]|nr:GNAT family N-acetyltransferase [Ktedonobacteraceae bacterium]
MPRGNIRPLNGEDQFVIERLLRTSEYIYQRFTPEELPLLLQHCPACGIFSGPSLFGFLLSQVSNPVTAWIGGFGVSWSESRAYNSILQVLLEKLGDSLVARGIPALYYSGNDAENDWLRASLLRQGFLPHRQLYSYDKYDYSLPTQGNLRIIVRPVDTSDGSGDLAALQDIEEACFEPLWRYDSRSLRDIAATHPYFMVAEMDRRVVGYQFNAVDRDYGYLIRIAVHPSVSGQGIGARLMAEAIRFFAQVRVTRIMLNTQEENEHAHRLYEWFGFIRLPQKGFVLRRSL